MSNYKKFILHKTFPHPLRTISRLAQVNFFWNYDFWKTKIKWFKDSTGKRIDNFQSLTSGNGGQRPNITKKETIEITDEQDSPR